MIAEDDGRDDHMVGDGVVAVKPHGGDIAFTVVDDGVRLHAIERTDTVGQLRVGDNRDRVDLGVAVRRDGDLLAGVGATVSDVTTVDDLAEAGVAQLTPVKRLAHAILVRDQSDEAKVLIGSQPLERHGHGSTTLHGDDLALGDVDLALAEVERGRGRRRRHGQRGRGSLKGRRHGVVVGGGFLTEVDTVLLAYQRREAGLVALGYGTELPVAVVTVELAEDHRRFVGDITLGNVEAGDLGAVDRVDEPDDRVVEVAKLLPANDSVVDIDHEDDLVDRTRHASQVDVDHLVILLAGLAVQAVAQVLDGTVGRLEVAEEHEVFVASHPTVGLQHECAAVEVVLERAVVGGFPAEPHLNVGQASGERDVGALLHGLDEGGKHSCSLCRLSRTKCSRIIKFYNKNIK